MKCAVFVALCIALVGAAAASEFTATPIGPRPSKCVHQVPAGADIVQVEGGVEVHGPNGSVQFLPEIAECVEDAANRARLFRAGAELRNNTAVRTARKNGAVVPGPQSALGWLDFVDYTMDAGVNLQSFTGYYTVPNPPQDTTGDEVLFYFIGTENMDQSDISILQPVLTWGNGLQGWSYASWNCCPSGQSHESAPLQGFASGDKLYGEILRDGTKWTISSIAGAHNTSLTVEAASRQFNWLDVTLEVYNIGGCSDFANGPMTFSDMKAVDTNGNQIHPKWQAATGQTQCNGKIQIDSEAKVVITHN